jgi:hypothetical protein
VELCVCARAMDYTRETYSETLLQNLKPKLASTPSFYLQLVNDRSPIP